MAPPPPGTPGTPAEIRVLFIGNSLTYTNDVPGMVVAIGEASDVQIVQQTVAGGNYALEDHWLNLDLRDRIIPSGWDDVVLQQGPSALPESRTNLIYWTQQFDAVIRQAKGHTALYMVWPDNTRMSAFDSVSASYRAAALAVNGLILPAGDAWIAAWRHDPYLTLYGNDGFHPSNAGSYLAALTIFCGLTGRSPLDVPLRPKGLADQLRALSDAQLQALRDGAADALHPSPSRSTIH